MSHQRRWIMFCRKAIRFATKHSKDDIHRFWTKDIVRYDTFTRYRNMKYVNRGAMYSLACAYHEGRLTKDGKFQ